MNVRYRHGPSTCSPRTRILDHNPTVQSESRQDSRMLAARHNPVRGTTVTVHGARNGVSTRFDRTKSDDCS